MLKNLLGLVFLAGSVILGPVPGPGGIVFFLVGFGLISFPGKRRFTVRIFRGPHVQAGRADSPRGRPACRLPGAAGHPLVGLLA